MPSTTDKSRKTVSGPSEPTKTAPAATRTAPVTRTISVLGGAPAAAKTRMQKNVTIKMPGAVPGKLVPPPLAAPDLTPNPAPVKPSANKPIAIEAAQSQPARSPSAQAKPVHTKPVQTKPVQAKPSASGTVALPKAPVSKAHRTAPAPTAAREARPAEPAPVQPEPLSGVIPAVLLPLPPSPETMAEPLRQLADTGLNHAREVYAKLRNSTETLTHGVDLGTKAATKGAQSFGTTLLDAMQTNADANFGFLKKMATVKTLSEAIALQSRHAREQFDSVTAQAKQLTGIASRTAVEAAEPMRQALDNSLRRPS